MLQRVMRRRSLRLRLRNAIAPPLLHPLSPTLVLTLVGTTTWDNTVKWRDRFELRRFWQSKRRYPCVASDHKYSRSSA